VAGRPWCPDVKCEVGLVSDVDVPYIRNSAATVVLFATVSGQGVCTSSSNIANKES
jgi:hypothetical protein